MLRPLPYPDPEQLVSVGVAEMGPGSKESRPASSMDDMRTAQQATDVFSHVAGAGSAFRGRIADGPQPERLRVAHYTEDYLPMHGVVPIFGRGISRADTEPGAPIVAVLGYGYWQSRFGGRRDVLGETIRLDEDLATIVGVLLWILDAGVEEFRTGWFIESVVSATLIVLVVRTRGRLFGSRPSTSLIAATLGVVGVTLVLPLTAGAGVFGFTAVPASFVAMMAASSSSNRNRAELAKRWFYARVSL